MTTPIPIAIALTLHVVISTLLRPSSPLLVSPTSGLVTDPFTEKPLSTFLKLAFPSTTLFTVIGTLTLLPLAPLQPRFSITSLPPNTSLVHLPQFLTHNLPTSKSLDYTTPSPALAPLTPGSLVASGLTLPSL